ncbi:MAG TPA: LCP family protein [Candidatus Binatia bacterium]|nr:LCP family protein [Candidatus Binatia bacterium]
MQNNKPKKLPLRRRPHNIDGFISSHRSRSSPGHSSLNPTRSSKPQVPPTKIIPVVRPVSSAREGSHFNPTIPGQPNNSASLNLPPDQIKKPRKKRNKLKISIFSVVVVLLLAACIGGWDVWQLDHKVHHINVGNLMTSVGGAENILVAGSTNRCNLTVQNAQWGFCSQGVTGVNSDIIFIVHLVPATHTVSLLSIPRDTFVPNARAGSEAFKIDAALYQGPTQLVDAVEQDFGIPIQHYAEVGFDGFVNIVNAVGGIKMDFPMPVYDSESYLNVQTPGCRVLNGVEALQVVRARHLQYKPASVTTNDVNYWPQEAESDIARIARTHEFLRVLASTVSAKGLSNPITDQKLIDAIAPQVQVDSGFSTSTMLELAQDFNAVNINNVPQYTLPIVTTDFGSYDYQGNYMGDVVFPVEANDQQTIDEFLGESAKTDTMTGQTLPSPKSVTVSVVNGSGTPDQASQTATSLQNLGFSLSGQPTTATPVSSQAQETVVYYASSQAEGDAIDVASQLTGYVILSENSSMVTSGSDVTVLTGTGLSVNSPTSSTSSSASSSSPSTATSSSTSNATTTSANTSLGPISSADQALSAWDPRACSSNQSIVN